ncbi:VOC family protein [candidate division WOR-3 bacterium]|nr:VOC family protein [candidate division WOR-3 bacterium]
MADLINWFEIPVNDFDRAAEFYGRILNGEVIKEDFAGTMMGFLPMEGDGIGGAISKAEGFEPSDEGTLVYFNCGEDLAPTLERIESAGGKVVVPKTLISPEIGYFAIFIDTEGNKLALHSKK